MAAVRQNGGRWRAFVLPVTLLLAAEFAAWKTNLVSDSLVPPSAVVVALVRALGDGTILRATVETLSAALAGLAIALGIGLAAGVLLGLFRIADRLMEFSIEAFRPIPSVALIPIAMLVFGFGYRMEISIVAFACTWPILLLTRAAVVGIEPRLLEVARALGFGLAARIWKVVLPAALPRIFVAFRLAAGVALIVGVTVEITTNPLGLGYGMMLSQQTLHPDTMFALLVWIGALGWSLNSGLLWIQSRLFGPSATMGVQQP